MSIPPVTIGQCFSQIPKLLSGSSRSGSSAFPDFSVLYHRNTTTVCHVFLPCTFFAHWVQ
ncbi:hypothetical protein HMPREF0239_01956 [Clostridium sp. ATCC BAA-442]|uniref:Uncharacterized protein n=1 Tax=Flavonifractor plautii ATCC 29863 TaxID=411475 RepID=G9YTX3_FLAPL|nr:hypothetical protein HMPREF0372_02984 [Flavonifractor plautii ATCC 29863]ERI76900.1 hypothetical protein HMPREF0239_01956 [Clostridium sp. ATCC BAA-442]